MSLAARRPRVTPTRVPSAPRAAILTVLLAVTLTANLGATTLFPCRPCAGMRTGDPRALAVAWQTDWQPAGEPRVFAAWPLPLDGTADAQPADALRQARLTPWISLSFTVPPPLATHLDALSRELAAAAAIARAGGPDAVYQVSWQPGGEMDPKEYAFLFKRASVAITGAAAGAHVTTAALPASAAFLRSFYGEEVAAYADVVALAGGPPDGDAAALTALAELDPGKPVVREGEAYPAATPSLVLADAARDAAAGFAAEIYDLSSVAAVDLRPLKVLAAEFQGDVSYDAGSKPAGAEGWAFVRGKDLALRVVVLAPTPGQSETLTFPDPTLTRIVRVDPASGREVGLGGRRIGNAIETTIPKPLAVEVLKIERGAPGDLEQVKERVEVTGEKSIPVEEILRRLQAFEDAQNRRLHQYEATNTTSLRFRVSAGVQTIEATFQGPYFVRQGEPPDWMWRDFFFNGVRWRGKTIPEIPLIQPQKAAAMPLEIHFTKEYRYSLRGSEEIAGRPCWVVDFTPLQEAAKGQHLYRGTVWIDQKLFARVRTRALQLGLEGEVISNEETLDYTPVNGQGQPAAWSADSYVLPLRVYGQQILSILNGTTLVEKETKLTDLRLNPASFEADRQQAFDSASTMVRDTPDGLRYLAKDKTTGQRVVREGFAKNKLFLVGGAYYERSLDYPLPLAGINYFSLDLKGTGKQFNVFFAGALATVSIAQPRVGGSGFDVGGNAFAIAVPLEDKLYVNGQEQTGQTLKSLPARASLSIGHPIGNFLKATFSYDAAYNHYQRTRDTAPSFTLPADHFVHSLSLDLKLAREGYQATAGAGYSMRSQWRSWGYPGNPDYAPANRNFWRWDASFSKTWSFAAFRRFGIEADYLGGRNLDRFSKYEFGFFGGSRVHGYASNRLRADQVWATHATYGFGIGDVFRIDAAADIAWATDRLTGLDHELLAGVGLVGTLVGPWETVINLDAGTPVAGPEHGVVVYVVFLKLFK